jgi:hypothetical protein
MKIPLLLSYLFQKLLPDSAHVELKEVRSYKAMTHWRSLLGISTRALDTRILLE